MPRYTIIAEHGGGTYVSQVLADCRDSALRIWLDDTNPATASAPYIHNNKRKHREKLEKQLTDPDFGLGSLTGCVNVWQCLFRIRKEAGSFHIIKTDEEGEHDAPSNGG